MTTHFILVKDSAVFVKDAKFFEEQGGPTSEWGRTWEPIEARSAYEARRLAIKLRRARFPTSHRTLGEDEPLDVVWPEARGK